MDGGSDLHVSLLTGISHVLSRSNYIMVSFPYLMSQTVGHVSFAEELKYFNHFG